MSEKITFGELVRLISARTNRSRTFTRKFVSELTGIIEAGLRENGSVTIAGFGRFELRHREARQGVHPVTGGKMVIPAGNRVIFRPWKPLRDHVNLPFSHLSTRLPHRESGDGTGADPTGTQHPEELLVERPLPRQPHPSGDEPGREFSGAGPDGFDRPDGGDRDEPELVLEVPVPAYREQVRGRRHDGSSGSVRAAAGEPAGTGGAENSRVNGDGGERPGTVGRQALPEPGKPVRRWAVPGAAALLLLALLVLFFLYENEPSGAEIPGFHGGELPVVTTPEPPAEEQTAPDEGSPPVTVQAAGGQTLWEIAGERIGDPFLWPWIFHLNSGTISDPDLITAGLELTVPVRRNAERLSGEENRQIATGYVKVYRRLRQQDAANARHFLWAAGSFSPEILDELDGSTDRADMRFARSARSR